MPMIEVQHGYLNIDATICHIVGMLMYRQTLVTHLLRHIRRHGILVICQQRIQEVKVAQDPDGFIPPGLQNNNTGTYTIDRCSHDRASPYL